jgi:glycosyltransferase involved in cell wall biosynthesis
VSVGHVALVSPYPTADQRAASGVAWYTQSLARALAERGTAVTVVAPDETEHQDKGPAPDGSQPARASTGNGGGRSRSHASQPPTGPGPGGHRTEMDGPVRVDRAFRRGPAGLIRAAAAALATGAPVVHVQHETFLYGGPDSVPAVLYALARFRQAGRGPVVTMHQVVEPATIDRDFTDLHRVNVPPALAKAGLSALQSSVARVADRLIVHEHAFRRTVPEATVFPLGGNGANGANGANGGNGTAGDGTAGDGPTPAELRARAGAAPDDLLVLCFGFMAPYKGFEHALEAARLSREAGGGRSPFRLVMAGSEHPRLRGQQYLRGLQERCGGVAHFTGFVPDAEVAAWFDAADAVLLPYPQPFSSSGVLAHAIARGTPALVSGALAEVIGFPAHAAVPLQPAELAARLDSLARDRARLAPLAALTTALQEGRSWDELAGRHLELYEEVIHAQRSPRRPVRVGSRR